MLRKHKNENVYNAMSKTPASTLVSEFPCILVKFSGVLKISVKHFFTIPTACEQALTEIQLYT